MLINQSKLIQFDGKVVDCVSNDYPRDDKSYDMLEMEPRGYKFISHKYITFSEPR